MKEKQQRSIRAFLGGQAGPAPAPVASPNSSSIECLSDDCLLLVLSRLTQSQRCGAEWLCCSLPILGAPWLPPGGDGMPAQAPAA